MKIKVLGCHGSEGPNYKTTAFLINDSVAIDAGTIVSAISRKGLTKIKNIFITHAHLDHIKDLAFLVDHIFDQIKKPIKIYGKPRTLRAIHKHLFNNIIWPDFSRIPTKAKPSIQFVPIRKVTKLNGITIEAIDVNHTVDCVGYLIKDKKSALAITGDTGPTKGFWRRLKREHNLKAVFAEVSFPSAKFKIAKRSLHYTPSTLKKDIRLLKEGTKVFIYHLKPPYLADITREISRIAPKWQILKPGKTIKI